MARPIIRPGQQGPGISLGGPGTPVARSNAPERVQLSRRGGRYLDLVSKLDAGGHVPTNVAAIAEAIRAEFDVGATLPLGLVSRCYLGAPFEVHIVDLTGQIVDHYHAGQPLPYPFERARRLATHRSYEAIEVYESRLVAVRADGSVSEIQD